ncbi:MAG: hypothetical protein E6J11_12665 [Chloroflexi bacterium]|nr:MAG: hypothetical protein E6J11_12665 [Chloroflexota bacterium]
MDDVVPSALQRLRAADIIRMAGLAVASMGQEYCRIGAVRATMRRGAKLLGIVDTSHLGDVSLAGARGTAAADQGPVEQRRCSVEVEIQSSSTWHASCTCSPNTVAMCRHAAALLYQWLAHPNTFVTPSSSDFRTSSRTAPAKREGGNQATGGQSRALQSARQGGQVAYTVKMRGPTPSANLVDILSQNGLSELRGIAREYDIATGGQHKQQLVEAIAGALRQPELVRRSASTLEKPQRQLLATLTLAGGSLSDEDLRSLYERFSFGPADSLQGILLSLQSKGLLFRTSLNSSPQQRIGLSGMLYDVGWYVPAEVQAVLRVSVPITPFDVEKKADGGDGHADHIQIQHVEAYSLLADLLLVARALDGCRMEHYDERDERAGGMRGMNTLATLRSFSAGAHDETTLVAPPGGLPSATALERLQSDVPRTAQFLRFAFRLLRLADLLHKDDGGMPGSLRLLPNAARLLLGPASAEVARDLFELWLTHAGYEELFDLQEEGLQLKCRTTPLNNPILRPGELEAENSEARQLLVALVAQAPLNQWVSFSAFARFIYRLNPTFLQKRQRLFPSPHWWLEQEEGRPLQPAQMGDWMRAEGHYLARLLRGPLHWWGISDLALSGDGRLLAFRLTPVAGLLLNGVEPVEQEVEEAQERAPVLDVLETGELLVESRTDSWPLIELIEDFAEVAGVRGGRLCYRLAPGSLAEALGRGQQPGNLLKLLRKIAKDEEHSNSPLSCLLAQLEGWIASYGRVRLYTGVSMVEVADNLVMRELSATTSLEEQIVKSITPTLMILTKQGMERIVEDLKRRGQSPLLHEEDYHGTK